MTPTKPEREMTTAGGSVDGSRDTDGIDRRRREPAIAPPKPYDRDDAAKAIPSHRLILR